MQSKRSFLKSAPAVSKREIVNISWTIVSSVLAISSTLVRYFSRSLYAPIPSSIPSNCPFIIVIGVFNSWDTAEKKFVRACSNFFSCSISASSLLFAFCKSERVTERLYDSLFRLFPSVPNSSVRCSSTVQFNCKSDIFSDMRLISSTGFVIIQE